MGENISTIPDFTEESPSLGNRDKASMVLGSNPRRPISQGATSQGLNVQAQLSFHMNSSKTMNGHRPLTSGQLFKPTLYKSYCEGSFMCEPNIIIGPQRNRVPTLSFHCLQGFIIVLSPQMNSNKYYITTFCIPYNFYSYIITVTVYQTCPKCLFNQSNV